MIVMCASRTRSSPLIAAQVHTRIHNRVGHIHTQNVVFLVIAHLFVLAREIASTPSSTRIVIVLTFVLIVIRLFVCFPLALVLLLVMLAFLLGVACTVRRSSGGTVVVRVFTAFSVGLHGSQSRVLDEM
jgi:hypothetical protein